MISLIECQYRNQEIPACNTPVNLRHCNSIICCSICPKAEYCGQVCGRVLADKQQNFNELLDYIYLIEIELFSYCNRQCNWCPNKQIDRLSQCNYLDLNILERLLQELKEANYLGKFSFSRYNEPFSQWEYFEQCLSLIKGYFPYATLVTNTNGDYLNKDIIQKTLINELTIMDYDCRGKDWCIHKLREWNIQNIQEYENYLLGVIDNKKILYYPNWPQVANISDRGGILNEYSQTIRNYPCFEPFHFLGINYDGTVSPCCNIRNDNISHQPYILGSLKNNTLKDILLSDKTLQFKQKISNGDFTSEMPCYYCNNKGGRYSRPDGDIIYE